jgi:3-hydroxybutyryl-CoA dehydrogenase
MGTSIVACLLAAGHCVVGIEVEDRRRRHARRRVLALLDELRQEGLINSEPRSLIDRFVVSRDYALLAGTKVVIEAITESLRAKSRALRQIEEVVPAKALVGSNTSAIPITEIQKGVLHPERILGLHWDEPAHVTRFMEIVRGQHTSRAYARWAMEMAERWWGKEPSLVRRDIRGFITNRISYALFREGMHLVESGVATIADVDRSLRNDVGWWIPFAGPFRYMDLMGVQAYETVMRDLLPELSCGKKVPSLIRRVVQTGGRGIANGRGFCRYTPLQARRWQKQFLRFNYEIRQIASRYPEDVGNRPR